MSSEQGTGTVMHPLRNGAVDRLIEKQRSLCPNLRFKVIISQRLARFAAA